MTDFTKIAGPRQRSSRLGFIIAQWLSHGGHYPAIAYQAVLAVNLAFQIAAFAYFFDCEAWMAALRQRPASAVRSAS